MLHTDQVEELVCLAAAMDREALVRQIGACRAGFPVDFTPQFLRAVPLDRLRHIFLALCLQCQRMPGGSAVTAGELVCAAA